MKLPEENSFNSAVMLESMAESVLITDTKLKYPGPHIIYVNAAFEKMTGWDRNEIIGKSPRILQGPDTDYTIFNDMQETGVVGHNGRAPKRWDNDGLFKKDLSVKIICLMLNNHDW